MSETKVKKILSVGMMLCITVISIFFIKYQYNYYRTPKTIKISDYKIISDDTVAFHIDKNDKKNRFRIEFVGWITIKKSLPLQWNTRLVLSLEGEDTGLAFPLKMIRRKEVKVNSGKNFDMCGFAGKIDRSFINEKVKYNIGFLVEVDRMTYYVRTSKMGNF